MSQATRYKELAALTGREKFDSSYQAAFYLLSYDEDLSEIASRYIDEYGIDFNKIKRAARGFDETSIQILDIAHNLFSWDSKCKVTPFDISRLGYPGMQYVCNAIYIAADQLEVVIQQNATNDNTIKLDAEPYQRTQRIHRNLEKVQAELVRKANEESSISEEEWER